VLHHHDRADSENLAGKGKATQNVVGHPSAGIADDMGFTQVESKSGEHINSGIHAGDNGHVLARTGIGHIGPGSRVALIGTEEVRDLGHGLKASSIMLRSKTGTV
jgi:hypothetical protein